LARIPDIRGSTAALNVWSRKQANLLLSIPTQMLLLRPRVEPNFAQGKVCG
jgi:hypothetical protein